MQKNWKALQSGTLSLDIFEKRAEIIDIIRSFFKKQSFLEVETPLFVKHPGTEPYLDLFESTLHKNNAHEQGFFITSPELQMKKILAAGFKRIFQITKSFRNGEAEDRLHNPEFTMLEWYRSNANYFDIMNDTESLIHEIASKIVKSETILYQKNTINLARPWQRMSIQEAFLEYVRIDLNQYSTRDDFAHWAQKQGFHISESYSWDDIFFQVFLQKIEPNLPKNTPLFLYDYPATQAALCKPCENTPFWAERFELYLGGIELCNAFSEYLDPQIVKEKMNTEMTLRKNMNKTTFTPDYDYIDAIKGIELPCGGNALGIDRLVMILLNQPSIQNVIFFPHTDL